jgi:hypothetical protein
MFLAAASNNRDYSESSPRTEDEGNTLPGLLYCLATLWDERCLTDHAFSSITPPLWIRNI